MIFLIFCQIQMQFEIEYMTVKESAQSKQNALFVLVHL